MTEPTIFRGPARAVCALVVGWLSAWAYGQTTQPGPLVSGPGVCPRPAVTGLKVVSSTWPDPTSLGQFGLDAVRLENARTAEEKAIAIWRWVRRVTMAAGSGPPAEPGDSYISEPALILNVYGDHHCDGLSRMMAAVWRASQGLPAMKLYRAGHTMADCWWVDADGVGRYHMFDVNYGYFLYSRDATRIVTCDDIGVDFSLEAFPSRTTRPWLEKQWWMSAWIHCGWPEPADYDGTMVLRAGDRAERLWGNLGRPYDDGALVAGPDPDGAAYPMNYGNGAFHWAEGFTGPWRDRLAVEPANADVRDGRCAQADPAQPAELVYRGRFPYVVADVDLQLAVARAGAIHIDTSVDQGRTWRPAWRLDCSAGQKLDLTLSKVQPKFDGPVTARGRASPSPRTPLGRYDYLLRIRLDGGAALAGLRCSTIVQLNYLVLPNLVPGDNRITISGELPPGHALQVAYLFDDADGPGKRHVVRAESLPFSYVIPAAGRAWHDIRCRSLTVEAVSADGRGSRVLEAPPPPKVLPAGPLPTLDARMLNGIVPDSCVLQPDKERYTPMTDRQVWAMNREPFAPGLGPAGKYIADLASPDEDTRRLAAAALTILRDKSAWDALEKLAIEDATRAKYYAVQALFWTDSARAWPVMEKILRRDPQVKFAPPARDRIEAPTHLNMSAMVAALCGRAKIRPAVPLISHVLLNESRDWLEPRWAMIRALGRIGDPSAIPTVRRFTRGGGADTNVVAIEALAELGDRESIPVMVEYLASKGYNIRPEAGLRGLAMLNAAGFAEQIVPLLASPRAERRWLAADALAVSAQPDIALPALRQALERETFPYARQRIRLAIEVLEKLPATQPVSR